MDKKLKARIFEFLYEPKDIASLAVVRILYGLIIMYEASRYIDLGIILAKYTGSEFHFKYNFFEWVEPLSTTGMQWVHIAYLFAGLAVALGIFYHLAVGITFLITAYLFLVEATNYLNHMYLVIVFTGILLFIPAHKGWSLYAFFNKEKAKSTVPAWTIYLLRFQIGLVYTYAAVAKMNVDWINGMPLYNWIGDRAASAEGIEKFTDLPIVIYLISYAGLFYDLITTPLLLNKKTREIAFCLCLSFHLMNYYLFNIGIFPWFMIAVTTIFFEPNWPRNILNFLFKDKFLPNTGKNDHSPQSLNYFQKAGFLLMFIHISFQALFPLRHFLIPSYVSWTEEGHNFSWHMKLRGKRGTVDYTVVDPDTGNSLKIDLSRYLTKRQRQKIAARPDLILQFAHYLRDLYTLPGEKPAEVYCETKIKINGRKAQRLIDPDLNLSNAKFSLFKQDWLLPIRQPVWNALHKKNRFGPAFKKDEIAIKAIHKYDNLRLNGQLNNKEPDSHSL